MSARSYYSNDDLRRAVENAFTTITPELLKRMFDCHFSHLSLQSLGGAFDCVLKITVNTLIFLMFNARAIDVIKFHFYANL